MTTGAVAPSPDGYPAHIICTQWGSEGDDEIVGTPGDDVLCGQGGNDTLYGEGGQDEIYGGDGDDMIFGGDTVGDTDGVAVENVYGDAGDDFVVTGDGSDWVKGGAGDDSIDTGDGSDTVWGDFSGVGAGSGPGGNDTVYTHDGNDSVIAGGGDDYVNTGSNVQLDSAEGESGDDRLVGDVGAAYTFDGGSGNDLLFPAALRGNPLGNVVIGGAGNDIAILVNGMPDGFITGDVDSVSIPVGGCSVDVPLTEDAGIRDWGLGCRLIGPVAIHAQGAEVSVSASFYDGSVSWSPGQWKDFADSGLGTFAGDLCICDPPVGAFAGDHVS